MGTSSSANTFRILDAAIAAERTTWLELWQKWPAREVQAHPSYLELFKKPSERVLLATMQDEHGSVLMPLVLRKLADEIWADKTETAQDLSSPYGGHGNYILGDTTQLAPLFWHELKCWAEQEQIVSLFLRCSLFREEMLPFPGEVIERFSNVVRPLDLEPDALWRDYAHKVRKNVQRARREGLTVECDPEGKRLDDFVEIYHHTMQRREASDSFFFPHDFFVRLQKDLPGQSLYFHVLKDDKVISTELVLRSANNIYSFLGGTHADYFEMRPNDLLKHEIISWGQKQKLKNFILGGGYGQDDGIFRYKLGFSPQHTRPFAVGHLLFSPKANTRLTETRLNWEKAQGRDWMPNPLHFPPYRA